MTVKNLLKKAHEERDFWHREYVKAEMKDNKQLADCAWDSYSDRCRLIDWIEITLEWEKEERKG